MYSVDRFQQPSVKPVASQQISASRWNAVLNLRFAKRPRGVRLVESLHTGPLYVQKAFYPEGPDCAHTYLLHPPGGLVTGDDLAINIHTANDCHVLVTTPGAGRVYRAREQGGIQRQNCRFKVEKTGVFEWLPLETILYPGSHARMDTQIELDEQARVIAWDIVCFGLPAGNLRFDKGSVQQRLQIWQAGQIQLNECLHIDEQSQTRLNGIAGLQNFPVHGLMIAGPFTDAAETLVQAIREIPINPSFNGLCAVTQVGSFICVRYLGECTEQARLYFTSAWQLIRPALIQKKVVLPRIWAT